MPLSPPVEREHLHTRQYHFEGFRRNDGLWDIEGRMTDSKTYGFENQHRGRVEAGEAVHDMRIRLTIDESFRIRDIEAVTEAGPFAVCPAIAPDYRKVIGERVAPGWRQKLKDYFGGVAGCTHLTELLGAMATVCYQTLYPELSRKKKAPKRGARPAVIDTCHAFASDSEVVKRFWPEHYSGE